MEKKRSGLSARGKQAVRNVKHIPDRQIDFSDIPEATDEELKRARRVGRPKSGAAKQLIAIRVDLGVLDQVTEPQCFSIGLRIEGIRDHEGEVFGKVKLPGSVWVDEPAK